jgi:hypothetical protein
MKTVTPTSIHYGKFNPETGIMGETTLNKVVTKQITQSIKEIAPGGESASITDHLRQMEAVNMNAGYLLSVLALVEEFRILKLRGYAGSRKNPDYYDNLWNILFTMRDLLDPKMSKEETQMIDTSLFFCRQKIDELFLSTQKGIYADSNSMFKVLLMLSDMFRYMLQVMNKIGMLTKKESSPLDAMKEMSE